jgi:two-component system response regulator MprA
LRLPRHDLATLKQSVIAPHVLIAEDDIELCATLVRGLEEEGFAARGFPTGSELLEHASNGAPDVLIVDIGLPDSDGRDVCQALRAQGIQTPVLFLTARGALTDRVSGFNAGGDDYLTKPFAFAELVARVQALLRRAKPDLALEAGLLKLDPVAHAAFVGEEKVPLTPTEFRLLARLVANPGETVRRRDLIRTAWPHGARVRENTLDAYLARLRRKLAPLPGAPTIRTVHGVGYTVD